MKTSPDLSVISETFTAEELVDANVAFVRGVIYAADIPEARFVTPKMTFEGRVCDCFPVVKRGKGFSRKPGFDTPIPVLRSNLGEPIAAIVSDGVRRPL